MKVNDVITLYINYKRSLGYRFRTEERVLHSFAKTNGNECITTISEDKLLGFVNGTGQITGYWIKKYHVLSGFYRFALARELVKTSPLPRNIPKKTAPDFIPYIYTHQEIKCLLDSIPIVCNKRASIDANVFQTLLLLLYGAGLRLGEALALTMEDINLSKNFLTIRETKFFKYRLVPFGKDLTNILIEYIAEKRNKSHTIVATTPLFCSRNGSSLEVVKFSVENFLNGFFMITQPV